MPIFIVTVSGILYSYCQEDAIGDDAEIFVQLVMQQKYGITLGMLLQCEVMEGVYVREFFVIHNCY